MTILEYIKKQKQKKDPVFIFRKKLDRYMREVICDFYLLEYGVGKCKVLLDNIFTYKVRQFTKNYTKNTKITKHSKVINDYVNQKIIPNIENYILFGLL